ncbi:sensor histidine kinase [Neisseria sp. Ec49-e6-T10]|uniref:sensor histidine kinase n=1 Tax=Neisseria sp. Ec49-e6-T10 TaxID=3140744 RepID=UPI003EBB01B8
MIKWFSSRTVFSMLLLNTLVSSCALVFVLVFSLQRIADEHPRRYLSKALFSNLVMDKTPEQLAKININGVPLTVIPQDAINDAQYESYKPLLKIALRDPDGIAIITNNDNYIAAAFVNKNHTFIVLPQFGRSLSSQALSIIGLITVVIVLILLLNFYSIHLLTKPFIELGRGVKHANQGDLNYRIPLNRTYGEYKTLADSFNTMLQRLHRIHEARRHMLLAIPHELRTPLTRLKVRKDLITDEPLRQAILGDIVNVERILDAILYTEKTHSGEDKINLSKINVAEFFNEIVLEQLNTKSLIELKMTHNMSFFYSHSVMLVVLMRNLIGNAVFYGQSQPVTIFVKEQGYALHISVTDRGIGIAEDQLPFLTEPFWREDESRQRESGGYGLGLYICKTIVDGLKGEIKIDSTKGKGTTVQVIFPEAFILPSSK